jgi:hypothetical protein
MIQPISRRSANARVVTGLKCAEMSPRKYTATTSHSAEMRESTSTTSHDCKPGPRVDALALRARASLDLM